MTDDFLTRRAAVARLGSLLALGFVAPPSLHLGRARAGNPFPHPDPRPGITAENVLPESKLPDKRHVREAFEAARTYPELFDGIYCPCECLDSMKHRSLLSCFESTQPIGCGGCREVAERIAPMHKEGKTLAEIRAFVDKQWG